MLSPLLSWCPLAPASLLGAAEPTPATAPAQAPPALWEISYDLRAGAGHRNNPLLSPFAHAPAFFAEAAAEVTVMRLSTSPHQFFAFASYEDMRFIDTFQPDHEQSAIVFAQYRYELAPDWILGGNLQYLFINQIMDASLTEGDFGVVQVKGHSVGAKPVVRWKPNTSTWLDLEPLLTRQWFEEPLDDYWEAGPKLTLGIDYGRRSELSLAGEFVRRDYDSRAITDSQGYDLPGESLRFDQVRFELTQRHHWDQARHWRTQTRLSYEKSRDNGSGYYDYNKLGVAGSLRWTRGDWLCEAGARVSQYRYDSQTLTTRLDETKERVLLVSRARIEYDLSKHWKLYAEAEYEVSHSNEPSDNYDVTTARAGIQLLLP